MRDLAKKYLARRVSRRDFVRLSTAAGFSAENANLPALKQALLQAAADGLVRADAARTAPL